MSDMLKNELRFRQFVYRVRLRKTVEEWMPWLIRLAGKDVNRWNAGRFPWVPRRDRDVDIMVRALIDEAADRPGALYSPELAIGGRHW
jgi:hypothetical protein